MTLVFRALLFPAAFVCSALAFPAVVAARAIAGVPAAERLAWELDGTWFDNLKNIWTELIRADPQWWGKCLAFIILSLIATNIYLLLKRRKQGD